MTGTIPKQLEIEKKHRTITEEQKEKQFSMMEGTLDCTMQGDVMKEFFTSIVGVVQQYIDAPFRGHRAKLRGLILSMEDDPKVLAYYMISNVTSHLDWGGIGIKATLLSKTVGESLIRGSLLERLKTDNPKLYGYLGDRFRRATARRRLELMEEHLNFLKEYVDLSINNKNTSVVKIGSELVSLLVLGMDNMLIKHKGRGNTIYLVPSINLIELVKYIREHKLSSLTLTPPPMIVKPKDWRGYKNGGYYTEQIPLIKDWKQRACRNNEDISNVLPIISKLQRTPWRINRRILDLVSDIFYEDMVDPMSPKEVGRLLGGISSYRNRDDIQILYDNYTYQKETYSSYSKERDKLSVIISSELQRARSFKLALDTAEEFVDWDEIYFVYQFDYRGRVYPAQSYLNPQMTKQIKPLLEFSNGEVLTEEGVYWYKIHTANCYGLDKEPFEDRIEWFDSNESDILTLADKPLEHKQLWAYADSPFEYVAACQGWSDYCKGLPTHVPIQLDAINSGVQVYSGILRDKTGALHTSVIGDKRADLYKVVSNKVNKLLEDGDYPNTITFKDSEGEDRIMSTTIEANSMLGKINRKWTKRNVMTVPYSVSRRGMSDQIQDMQEDEQLKGTYPFKGDKYVVNKLLTDLNHRAIYDTLEGAKLGQEYLVNISKLIDKPASYLTPIYNFPVYVQAYKDIEVQVSTPLGRLVTKSSSDDIDRRAHTNGIAPNVIHSLDATILLGVIDRATYDIGVIHDCFISHANYGNKLQTNFKESYVALMKTNPLEYIGKQIDKDGKYEIPCIGDLDLDEVMNSKYIIS